MQRVAVAAPAIVPGALIVFFGFKGGGFFPTAHASVALGLLVFLVLRTTLARHPFEGLSAWHVAVAVPLALFTIWTLLSSRWGPDHRALLEYDRALMYLAGFVAFAMIPRGPERIRWTIRGLVAGAVVVCGSGLITELAPDLWPTEEGAAADRLSYPITYWNALGLLASIGSILAVHLGFDRGEPAWARIAGALALPVLLPTLYLTYSRGAILVLFIGLGILAVLGRPNAKRRAAVVVAIGLVAVVAGLVSGALERQYERFVEGDKVSDAELGRRLSSLNPGNNGRLDQWNVALEGFKADPLRGNGAGTFVTLWQHHRDGYVENTDAHSLYFEVLGELGIVGLVLLLAALGAIVAGLLARSRGPDRAPHAAILSAVVAWALHAGIDWDWEMPVITFWVFAVAAAALALPPGGGRLRSPARPVRVAIGIGCLILMVTPYSLYRSQTSLDRAVDLVRTKDCRGAIDAALRSAEAVGSRPEPFEVIGYCDVRLGYADLAEQAMRKAVARDPESWEFHYGLALVRGAFGKDPREATAAAYRRNRFGRLAIAAADQLSEVDDPDVWKVRARALPLPGY